MTARVITPFQLSRTIARLENSQNGFRNQTIIILSYYLGLSASEICSLKMWMVVENNGTPKNILSIGKREIPITHPIVIDALTKWVQFRFTEKYTKGNSFLFRSQKKKPFTPNSMSRMIKKVYQDVGYSGCTSHSAKKSMIVKMLDSGVTLSTVQHLVGHADPSTTRKYKQDQKPDILGNIMSNL